MEDTVEENMKGLFPVSAPYFQGADLLIASDCTAYAYANMHNDYMKGRVTLSIHGEILI